MIINIKSCLRPSGAEWSGSGMEWKECREQHPGGYGGKYSPHINNMSDQRIRSRKKTERLARRSQGGYGG